MLMDKIYRACVAEFIGTFVIVVVSAAACAGVSTSFGLPRDEPYVIVLVALVSGAVVAVMLPIIFRESPGCLNPAVTLTFWICKRLDNRQMGLLIAAQLFASLVAGLAIRALFPEMDIAYATPHVGKKLLDQTGNAYVVILIGGVMVEALVTFLLTFVIFGSMIDKRTNRFGGILVGVAQAAIVAAFFNVTGGCANPARWFGPYVWQFSVESIRNQKIYLTDHPVYWAGPILGAVAAGWLYTKFLLPPDQATEEFK
jgi:glycerol uptake facilitator-like aquaporin